MPEESVTHDMPCPNCGGHGHYVYITRYVARWSSEFDEDGRRVQETHALVDAREWCDGCGYTDTDIVSGY